MLPISTFLALKYIKSKKRKYLPSLSFFTSFIGIFLSVFALVVVISVMEGFKEEFQKTIIGIRPHIKIFAEKNGKIVDFPKKNLSLEQFYVEKNITHVGNGISGEVILINPLNERISGSIISGLQKEDFESRPILKNSVIEGSLEHFNKEEGLIIGNELASQLGLYIGSEVNVVLPIFRKTAIGSIPIHKTFKVKAIFNVGMYFYDSTYIFMPLAAGEQFFRKEGKAGFIEILLQNPHRVKTTRKALENYLGPGFYITDWQSENKSFIEAINLQKSVMFFILLIFLLLASFIMFSSLSSLVNQKNKSTAILRTMGFKKKEVMFTFFQVGIFTAGPAIIAGLCLGASFSYNLEKIKNWIESLLKAKIFDGAYYFLSYIPSSISGMLLFRIFLIIVGMCLISIILPSFKAIKTEPIESLKWE